MFGKRALAVANGTPTPLTVLRTLAYATQRCPGCSALLVSGQGPLARARCSLRTAHRHLEMQTVDTNVCAHSFVTGSIGSRPLV